MRFLNLPFSLMTGTVFEKEPPEIVESFLEKRKLSYYDILPSDLHLSINENKLLLLEYRNGSSTFFPVRESFIAKLFSWYGLPTKILMDFEVDTSLKVMKNIFKTIKGHVTLVVENGEALTLVSKKYSNIKDEMIIKKAKQLGIEYISRNDFFTRIYFERKRDIQPIPGDIIGCSFNIFNSETGLNAFYLKAYLLRVVCSNGAIFPIGNVSHKLYHYNIDPINVYNMIDKELEKLSDVYDNLEIALRKLAKRPFDTIVKDAKNKLNRIMGFPWGQDLLLEFENKRNENLTVYDFYNFITDKAKEVDVYKSMELESYAGDLVTAII